MGTTGNWVCRLFALAVAGITGIGLSVTGVHAQLAVTEMMSKSANTFGQTSITNDHDYWELTNFGSNTINLANYWFQDDDHKKRLIIPTNEPPLFIGARESVIFVRGADEAFFRGWWGPCVGPNVQIRCYPSPGFSSYGDSISIWDPHTNLVDFLSFPPATRGVSFVYDPITGAFPSLSKSGVGGACRAATADDAGSPGTNTGPIALQIVQQPVSLVVCTQLDATFTVGVIGMPRPRSYAWYRNGSALPGRTNATLTVSNATGKDQGSYSVIVGNGITTLRSSDATLTIDTNLSAPMVITPPIDTTVLANNSDARFSISVCANPVATYQWFSNGVAIPGGIGPKLFVPFPTLDMSGWEFSVRVQNARGTTNVAARLYVLPTPDLRITELQANPVGTNLSKSAQCGQSVAGPLAECVGHDDWFEVTNFGTNAVNLLGYRFSNKADLASAVSITEPIVIQPNESVIFAKGLDPAAFVDWWGADQLPPGLKIFAYGGMSLSSGGDNLYLWSAAAEYPAEAIYTNVPCSFTTNLMGQSLWFDYDSYPPGADSVVGKFGGFRAAHCGDIGSPGYITNPPPRLVSISKDTQGAKLKWRAVEKETYRIEYNAMPRSPNWSWLGTLTATTSLPTMNDPGAANASQRFYRIIQQQTP